MPRSSLPPPEPPREQPADLEPAETNWLASHVARLRRPGSRVAGWKQQVDEPAHLLAHLLRWTAIGAVVGGVAGVGSAAFLHPLTWATQTRVAHPVLLWFLPLAGVAVALGYHRLGGRATEGTNLVLDEVHDAAAGVPTRMAPLVLGGTVVTHLFGGSAGREGAAVQISASLADTVWRGVQRTPLRRLFGEGPADRRMLLVAAIAAGFGSVFGVPLAGAVFGLEVQAVGRVHYDALVPCLAAAIVGDQVTRQLGIHHALPAALPPIELTAGLGLRLVVAGVVFGLVAAVFIELSHGTKRLLARRVRWMVLRPVLGGVAVLALTGLAGTRAYLGLSLPLIDVALAGTAVAAGAWAWKLVFTAVTLGSGFPGGEVTALFCVGACLGSVLAGPLGVSRPLLAALGYVAVFAAAANTPLALTVLSVEVFGAGALLPFAVTCVVASRASGHRSVYPRQRVAVAKGAHALSAETVADVVARRQRRR